MATTRAELVPGPEPPQAAVASTLLQDVMEGTRLSGISSTFPLNRVNEPSDVKGGVIFWAAVVMHKHRRFSSGITHGDLGARRGMA